MPVLPTAGNALPSKPLLGTDETSAGITGQSNSGPGVLGQSLGLVPPSPGPSGGGTVTPFSLAQAASDGVLGESSGGNGVHGVTDGGSSHASTSHAGVWGDAERTNGVYGSSADGNGVAGDSWSASSAGVAGQNNASGPGVSGSGTKGYGVSAQSTSTFALYAKSAHGAALLDGTVTINGDVTINANIAAVKSLAVSGDVTFTGGDCAEHFDQASAVPLEAGTVVVIDGLGAISECRSPYDRKVAGVIAGAGSYRPAIVLDNQASDRCRPLVALVGKTFCKADAAYGAIEVGDLVTTSETPGHAMKASDPGRAFGAVVGKALGALASGRGLVPILIALQ